MRILIIGGTQFYGRHLVEAALAAGHQVSIFNRGRTNPGLFPPVEELHGDRKSDLSALHGKNWEAVIDPSGYFPGEVDRTARLLAGSVETYTFISSVSVYADFSRIDIGENAPVNQTRVDETTEEITGENYGPLKVLCEKVVAAALPGRDLIIRPGLIVGPHDPTDRFTYWPARLARGGEVLAPGQPKRKVQFIDVRDLAEWTIRMVSAGKTGLYNADGPDQPVAMEAVLAACHAASLKPSAITWVDEDFLESHRVEPWIQLPLWIPEKDPESTGFFSIDVSKAVAAGLTYRPLEETVQDTLTWEHSRPANHAWRAGLSSERETALLQAWHSR